MRFKQCHIQPARSGLAGIIVAAATVTARSGLACAILLALALSICSFLPGCSRTSPPRSAEKHRLPTGASLDPAGSATRLGSMPVAMQLSPDSTWIVAVLSGYREQGIQVIDRRSRRVVQTIVQPAAFLGAAFTPDGRKLFVSGGDRDRIYVYDWHAGGAASRVGSAWGRIVSAVHGGPATLTDSIALGAQPVAGGGKRYPAGIACSRDGSRVYVAENLSDSLAVVDVASRRVVQRVPSGRYPCAVVVGPDGRVYVSAWGESWIATFRPGGGTAGSPAPAGLLEPGPRIPVGRHPSTILLDPTGKRLYATCASSDRIAIVDTDRDSVIVALNDSAPGVAGSQGSVGLSASPRSSPSPASASSSTALSQPPPEGSTPDGLALSPDGRILCVAEADNNAVAVFSLSAAASGLANGPAEPSLLGRIPVEWYPTAVLTTGKSLWVLNGKGAGTAPNPKRGQPGQRGKSPDPSQYTLGQTNGSLTHLSLPEHLRDIDRLSARVAVANGWNRPPASATASTALPPFRHVIYIVRENRTYDQVFGDLAGGDGDTSLTYFPRSVTPNAHALAERFGIFDRFFVNAAVSADGHNWTMAAYATDYLEKTLPSEYSGRGRPYDYDGLNRDSLPQDDVCEPANGYLWDLAERAQVSLRNYGEFTRQEKDGTWRGNKPWLDGRTDPKYPGWDLAFPDTARAARWMEEFQGQVAGDSMPALTILWLPNDHTSGGQAGLPTPRVYAADNDLALGRVIEALTHSPYWKDTVVFVLEDDAQDGPDHVDSHRSPMLVISAYNRPGVIHRFANTTDVIATIDRLLGFGSMSQFDYFGRPLAGIFAAEPDTTPYTAVRPAVPMGERNPESGTAALLSAGLDFRAEDRADVARFNRALWVAVKGEGREFPAQAGRSRVPRMESPLTRGVMVR